MLIVNTDVKFKNLKIVLNTVASLSTSGSGNLRVTPKGSTVFKRADVVAADTRGLLVPCPVRDCSCLTTQFKRRGLITDSLLTVQHFHLITSTKLFQKSQMRQFVYMFMFVSENKTLHKS